ncbi:Rha family transcriptional regulator [Streptococcus parasanguinis]|uniref:Rha family transcriptional regulator n=1 Tax=Streptococcus parasanguinis TaxID=1318 RepID=UPI0039C020F9
MELVYMDGKKEPYTTSAIIAECAGIKHHAIQEHIRKQIARLEQFGKVSFKMRPLQSGQQAKDYILNEQQATLLITFLKNTEQVANFKTNLVKAFFEMREELSNFRMQRALEKPKRKTLHDSIENWEQAPKHAHSTMNNLLLKAVTDRNAKQLVEERGGYNGIDSLTSEELEQYQAFEDMAIAMISLNMSYQEIKAMAFRNKKNTPKRRVIATKKGLAITTPQSLSHYH